MSLLVNGWKCCILVDTPVWCRKTLRVGMSVCVGLCVCVHAGVQMRSDELTCQLPTCEAWKAEALIAHRKVNAGPIMLAWWWLTLIKADFTQVTWRQTVKHVYIEFAKDIYYMNKAFKIHKGWLSVSFLVLNLNCLSRLFKCVCPSTKFFDFFYSYLTFPKITHTHILDSCCRHAIF